MNSRINIVIAAEFDLAEKIIEQLERLTLPLGNCVIAEIYPFTEEQGLRFHHKTLAQHSIEDIDWSEYHYVFFAGEAKHTPYLLKATEADCIVIDMLGVCASLGNIPLVVPGVNEDALSQLREHNIVSLPDAQVTQFALTLAPIMQQLPLQRVFVTTLLPVSYQKEFSVERLAGQTARLLNGMPLDEQEPRLAFDVFPPSVALPLNVQIQKIFGQDQEVLWHSVHVPVFYGMAQQVSFMTEYPVDTQQLVTLWQSSEWIQVNPTRSTPVQHLEQENDQDEVKLAIALSTLHQDHSIQIWSVCDEQRFSVCCMAVTLLKQIYQLGY